MNKEQIIEYLQKYNLDNTKYVVISGAAMVLYGIKELTHDIDISVSKDYYDYLLNNYECEYETKDINNENVYYIDKINFGKAHYPNENIYINNIPVEPIDEIIKLKKTFNRDKDKEDIELIKKYLKNKMKNEINPLVLAYLGDSVYDVYIRKYLIDKNIMKVDQLQKKSIKYVSAKGQAGYIRKMIEDNFFSDQELSIIYRARNHKSHKAPKNTDVSDYKYSTGLEALIGYHYINNNKKRIEQIIDYILED